MPAALIATVQQGMMWMHGACCFLAAAWCTCCMLLAAHGSRLTPPHTVMPLTCCADSWGLARCLMMQVTRMWAWSLRASCVASPSSAAVSGGLCCCRCHAPREADMSSSHRHQHTSWMEFRSHLPTCRAANAACCRQHPRGSMHCGGYCSFVLPACRVGHHATVQ